MQNCLKSENSLVPVTSRFSILGHGVYLDEIHPAKIDSVERHNETDEIFVLIKGQGILFVGDGNTRIEKIHPQVLESGKIYNVKRGVWHTIVLSQDGSVLIVENQNTSKANSDYFSLSLEHKRQIQDVSNREQPGRWR
jgi:mannose-6-phosphate isomerase-like protein (cupin superfamily)